LRLQGKHAASSRRLLFAGTCKFHDRVKLLVTVAGGFAIWPFTVNALARRLDYLGTHE
jgi:hypothetical protein